ncbi:MULTISPECIES: UDP-N-acetylglucosamine--LPS N-acetylglucosamine transferase [unclassified Hahella]|uniref:UDP-N-acetylglucosamine--LPS N-acetylglucosamine transferase n=1 Tax=unclassified Hahella TaxID=2624107 RepID=UPI001C1F0FA5|nr:MULTISPECIES: UDP-N-acetylglucosamine--LPS N-acetylglucosamine transferase [unclassified Hahella]MBU6955391.1 UDP-N-acetylglucosamine--LPS N-acetylglucosamine transferase [Hahella sp. HN01]MDG9669486.1 UDP-N-acetylglucosamine--LPS N-acetylglucosamine transferase [Hahella sp. CR1]
MKKILLVASGGGHWVQLQRLRGAFEDHKLLWMTTVKDYSSPHNEPCFIVQDANMWNKLALLKMFLQVAWVMLKTRPDIVVTTGAAPGFAAILYGRLLGARTIWIDSIANGEALSQSGAKVGRWAHVWLTQWEHLSKPSGPHYWGAVL